MPTVRRVRLTAVDNGRQGGGLTALGPRAFILLKKHLGLYDLLRGVCRRVQLPWSPV